MSVNTDTEAYATIGAQVYIIFVRYQFVSIHRSKNCKLLDYCCTEEHVLSLT